jgi:PadR family transcriptional regulator PadR
MKIENAVQQMRKGVLEYCVLAIIARGEIYASDIIEEMKAAKLLIVEGTLYPLLTRLKNSGLLAYKWVESTQGPPRKYFVITEEGKAHLEELHKAWKDLNESVSQATNPIPAQTNNDQPSTNNEEQTHE